MNYRPYPDRDRALAQLERHRPPQPPLITSFAQLQTHIASGDFHRRIYAAIANFNAALACRAGASVAANATVFTSAVQARADAEAALLRAEASGLPKCAGCGHAQHAPGSECEAGVNHGPKRWHRCLCLAAPGASTACPPQMDCQGGTLSFSDVWHLRQGRSVLGPDGESITPDALAERQPIVLARVVQTCQSVPSQWNAWTTSGQYLYLRYRSGIGTVDAYDSPEPETWPHFAIGSVARFEYGGRYDGDMDLTEFCERAGLQLADDAEVTGE
ncbi:hypothetical protein ACIRJO_02815 [Streptomyces sp. NPDC102394]|uniref:hypothetical protein n=1 Tax=Streptomyces sp. NPDC102394 TaxID=3366167 RepID=UPI0037FEC4BE